jgi:hypothetical protein
MGVRANERNQTNQICSFDIVVFDSGHHVLSLAKSVDAVFAKDNGFQPFSDMDGYWYFPFVWPPVFAIPRPVKS